MRVPILLSCAIYLTLLFPSAINAQLSEAEKSAAIQTIAKSIADNYVDAHKRGRSLHIF